MIPRSDGVPKASPESRNLELSVSREKRKKNRESACMVQLIGCLTTISHPINRESADNQKA
uniref:Uncharacterized protein n=2 Tax=Rhizophora mucronata TaxID=61149 RepID=A0A2P2MPD2_RHIMU